MHTDIAISHQAENLIDIPQANQDALTHPIGNLPLREHTKPGERICIVFTDNIHGNPDYPLVTALLTELEKAGILDDEIMRLCGRHAPLVHGR